MTSAPPSPDIAASLLSHDRASDPCVMVIFGATGDLTKRLLMPALYNLACDGLLPVQFAIVGIARESLSSEEFRARLSDTIKTFSTRKVFDQAVWDDLVSRVHYSPGNFDDLGAFAKLASLVDEMDGRYRAGNNILFYMATPPSVFGLVSRNLTAAGFKNDSTGWRRIIVEKPFGHDLPSAIALNEEILAHWDEDQVFRIDHYLGKETVQNLLAFRFSNGLFEPLWNRNHIDHIQFTVSEMVGVEGRGGYYDTSGVLRDMMQNHMFQMLAYLCMEPPSSFKPEAIRNEKAKLLDAIRIYTPQEVLTNTARGQYGPGRKADGAATCGYREEPKVNPQSNTETFAAAKLMIDNWRWDGVPVYLRSGKALWKRDTEIMVQFKKAPEVIFRGTPAVDHLAANQLLFHIQPDQGIELRFQAKVPGPRMHLQKVNMRFDYKDTFDASRGTGYEALVYQCMLGDATLFSRTDLVETAWRIAQPMLDTWAATPGEFPNYAAGSWGPKAAFDLIERDGRKWVESLNRGVLERIPLFQGCDAIFLHALAIELKPVAVQPGQMVLTKGDPGDAMYVLARGAVEVVDGDGKVINTLREGDFFGETSLLLSEPRTASIRASTYCDLYMLDKADFRKALRERPEFARTILETSRTRYKLSGDTRALLGDRVSRMVD